MAESCRATDVLIHKYFDIDQVIVWDVVTNKLSGLEAVIREMAKSVE
jgi:uncharacterized protein with HEPN domain